MQVLLVGVWLLMMGMQAVDWDGGLETQAGVPTDVTEVTAADGPLNPPPKP